MTVGQESLTEKEKQTKKREYPRKRHFRNKRNKRYCTNYPKGKDELVDEWKEVDCDECLRKKEIEDYGLVEKLRKSIGN
jgi:hypothetical protein